MSASLIARQAEELSAKRMLVADLYTRDPQSGEYNMSADTIDDIMQRNAELDKLTAKHEETKRLASIEGGLRPSVSGLAKRDSQSLVPPQDDDDEPTPRARKLHDLGSLFAKSQAYKSWKQGIKETGDFEVEGYDPSIQLRATTMTEAAGFAPQAIRTGRIVDIATRPPRVIDAYSVTTTDQVAVVYMEETTFTNNAAETSENSAIAAESALAYTERTSTVRKIAVHIAATDEQLADVAGMTGRINNRLELMLRQRLDLQLVAGDGNAPNLLGILSNSGRQTQARGTDPEFDAVFKAIVLGQFTAFADPDTILFHPNNWQTMRLTRTSEGLYVLGNPDAPANNLRLWGLPIIVSTAVTANSGIVGDFANYAEINFKQGIEFAVTNSHASEFTSGVQRIKATLRAAHVLYRPGAFIECTGLR